MTLSLPLVCASVTVASALALSPAIALAQDTTPSATPSRITFVAEEEPVQVQLEAPSGARSEPCTTPCSINVLPMTYTIHGVDGTNAWRSDVIGSGSHRFLFRAPHVSGGGVALTVLGSIGLVLGAVFIPLGVGARSWDALLFYTIGAPSAVIGAAEFIPGVAILARGHYRDIERVMPSPATAHFAPFVPSTNIAF